MFVCFAGNPDKIIRNGKTLGMVYFGHKAQQAGIKIFSNLHLNYPHTYLDNPNELLKIEKGLVLLDEFWTWCDARRSTSGDNLALSYFALQSGKQLIHGMYTDQSGLQADIRVRKITERYIIPTILYRIFMPDKRLIFLTKLEMFNRLGSKVRTLKVDLGPYTKMYNTLERIQPKGITEILNEVE